MNDLTPQQRVDRALDHVAEIRALFGSNGVVSCNVHGATLADLGGVDGDVTIFPATTDREAFARLEVTRDGCHLDLFARTTGDRLRTVEDDEEQAIAEAEHFIQAQVTS